MASILLEFGKSYDWKTFADLSVPAGVIVEIIHQNAKKIQVIFEKAVLSPTESCSKVLFFKQDGGRIIYFEGENDQYGRISQVSLISLRPEVTIDADRW
jgi:hypothetical protein